MKKSTLILLLLAVILGGVVYYYEFKHPIAPASTEDESKAVYTFSDKDIASIEIQRGGETADFERKGGGWAITKPLETGGDATLLDGIANAIATARSSRTLAATPAEMASYGLATPAVVVRFQLKDGHQHELRLGATDFSGGNVYAQTRASAAAKQVLLLPQSLLGATDKPYSDLRDKNVLDVNGSDITWFELKNAAGDVTGARQAQDRWMLETPRAVAGNAGEISGMLTQVSVAKMTSLVSETPEDLAKYGLEAPAITLQVRTAKGESKTLLLGKKADEEFYARDASRPMIFKIGADLEKKLSEGFAELRDKSLTTLRAEDLSRIEIHTASQTISATKGKGNTWVLEQPADHKGKAVQFWRLFDPISGATATEILENAPAPVSALLAKPAARVILTESNGKATPIIFTVPSGDAVYARVDDSAEVYKLDKSILDQLNFKLEDVLEPSGR